MNFFDFEGARIAYEDIGTGIPVILVHGTLWHEPWGKFKPLLAKKFRVISLHLPGYGDSQVVPGRVHDLDLMARSLGTLARHLNIMDAPIIALSMGAAVAARAAQQKLVKGTLILAGMPTQTFGFMVILSHLLPKIILRQIAKIDWVREKVLLASISMNTGWHNKAVPLSRRFVEGIKKTSPEAIADMDYVRLTRELPHTLAEITNRKYFIYGQYDIQKNGAKAWGIKYETIKKAGHDIFADQPEETFKMVTKHLFDTP